MFPGKWLSDLRHGARTLSRSPGFVITSVLMLGLAVGAISALFSVVNTVLLKPLPFAEPDRVVHIAASAPGSQYPAEFPAAAEFYVQYSERSTQLSHVASYNSFTNTLRYEDRVERPRMSVPTHSLYGTLGVKPELGRLPEEDEDALAVVISDWLWAEWFGRDPDVIGKNVEVLGEMLPIRAVMPSGFNFPTDDTRIWISRRIQPTDVQQPGRFGNRLVARMAPGATPLSVANELDALAAQLPERFGGDADYLKLIAQHRAVVRPITEQLLGSYSRSLWVMLGAAGFVLLIACANVTNLFMVRAEGRHREMAVRRALGAGRGPLLRLQLAEALWVAVLAGVLAVVLQMSALPLLLHFAPARLPRMDQIGIDAISLVFTAAAALLAGLLCGILPAFRAASPRAGSLNEGGRAIGARRHLFRHVLVAGQTALALVLLIGSGLLMRSVLALHNVNPGYDARDVFTFQIAPDRPELDDAPAFGRFQLQFLERLSALPGVESVGLVENVPLDEGTATTGVRTEQQNAGDEGAMLNFTYTAGDYFQTMGISVLAGRSLNDDDQLQRRGNLLISRSAAERLWPNGVAVGQRLKRDGQAQWETVVGVVEDVRQDGINAEPEAVIYLPLVGPDSTAERPVSSPAYVVRTSRGDGIAPDIRRLVREVAPEAPMYREFTLSGLVDRSLVRYTFTLLTLGFTALLALVLGGVGLYGVLSYVVAERTREIGVRMALGAKARQVRAMVVRQGARVVAIGVVAGLLVALLFTRLLDSLLYGVQSFDGLTVVTMSLAMLATGLLASYLPARRASNLNPNESLRRE